MIADAAGNLYGSTNFGGAIGQGVVFELFHGSKELILYNFCQLDRCSDGEQPGALTIDAAGRLYGTAATRNHGIIFKLVRSHAVWTETVLYHFCRENGCRGGSGPSSAPLVLDSSGSIYGTATHGGQNGAGTVYRLHGKLLVPLYSFCQETGCKDGNGPVGGVIMDGTGALYGTTYTDGAYSRSEGTVFSLTQ